MQYRNAAGICSIHSDDLQDDPSDSDSLISLLGMPAALLDEWRREDARLFPRVDDFVDDVRSEFRVAYSQPEN